MKTPRQVPYVGKSEYCYSNALHMVLSSQPRHGWRVPTPGELECVSTMPFGETFLLGHGAPEFFFGPANTDPDKAIDLALKTLGWSCKISIGDARTSPSAAVKVLRAAVETGPALVGPVDLGGLVQNPRAKYLRGGDHFVAAYEVDEGGVSFHDPFGFPHAWLPTAAFLRAWRVGKGYWRGPYTVRWDFQPRRPASRLQQLRRTIPKARTALGFDPGGPSVYGSLAALEQLQTCARRGLPRGLRETLVYFSLPLGARRRLDAARFVEGARLFDLARLFDQQSWLLGHLQFSAVKEDDRRVAQLLEEFGELEARVLRELS